MRRWSGLRVAFRTLWTRAVSRSRVGPSRRSSRRLLGGMVAGMVGLLVLGGGWVLGQQPEEPAVPRYEPPQVLSTVDAAYPIQSVVFGTVVLEVELSATGKVVRVEVVRDIPPLTDSAEQAVKQWKFKPARLDGRPVASSLPVAFTFVRPDVWPRLGVPR